MSRIWRSNDKIDINNALMEALRMIELGIAAKTRKPSSNWICCDNNNRIMY
jgi:hypothetical protein